MARFSPHPILSALLTLCLIPALGYAQVSVTWERPESFADANSSRLGGSRDRANVLAEIESVILRSAEGKLDQRRLHLTITDLDLEGEFEPWRPRLRDVRVVRDIYPARVSLHHRLEAPDGSLLSEGSAQLSSFGRIPPLSPASRLDRFPILSDLLRDHLRQILRHRPE